MCLGMSDFVSLREETIEIEYVLYGIHYMQGYLYQISSDVNGKHGISFAYVQNALQNNNLHSKLR